MGARVVRFQRGAFETAQRYRLSVEFYRIGFTKECIREDLMVE